MDEADVVSRWDPCGTDGPSALDVRPHGMARQQTKEHRHPHLPSSVIFKSCHTSPNQFKTRTPFVPHSSAHQIDADLGRGPSSSSIMDLVTAVQFFHSPLGAKSSSVVHSCDSSSTRSLLINIEHSSELQLKSHLADGHDTAVQSYCYGWPHGHGRSPDRARVRTGTFELRQPAASQPAARELVAWLLTELETTCGR